MTAQTATASTVHHPIGKPGGPGLFHVAGLQLPAYIQNLRDGLMRHGHSESQATEMAIGIVADWRDGHDGHGSRVSAEVQAAATKAMAEYDAARARAKVSRSMTMTTDQGTCDADGLDASWDDLGDLPDLTGLDVADLSDGSETAVSRAAPALGTGARFARLKAALASKGAKDPGALAAYIGRRKLGKAKFTALAAKARRGRGGMSRSSGDWRQLTRPFLVDDLRIMRAAEGEGSGRMVEGYAAVFSQPQPIRDSQGEYEEIIDPRAFDSELARMAQRRGGIGAAVRVLFNHGKSIEGQPAPEFQKPIGRAQEIIPDSRGLLTRTEFNRTPLAEEVLELIRSGSITGMSFQGSDLRSDPSLRGPGDRYRRRSGGALTTVRRMVLGLMEYSPVVFEAYPGAEFLGVVRMGSPEVYDDVTATDGGFTEDEEAGPAMEGAGAGGIPAEMYPSRDHAHRLLVTRMEERCRAAGLVLPGRQ